MVAHAIPFADWSIPKKSSTLKQLGQMNRNVVGSIYGRSSIKITHLGSVNKDGQHRQFVLLIGRLIKQSSPLKPLGQMNRNLIGSSYGKPSITIAHFVPIC
jgi:ABC-type phosphate transport system auxiliary subunit